MPKSTVNGINIAYEIFGVDSHPTLLLIHGLGMSSAGWPPALIDYFVRQSFQVVVFDNRDIGQSELFTSSGAPNIPLAQLKRRLGFKPKPPYTLNDMMLDTIALLDFLGIEKSHVIGVAMGGMIAQLMVIDSPERVSSLTSIMSTSHNPGLLKSVPEVTKKMLRAPKSMTPKESVQYQLDLWKLIGSPAYPSSDAERQKFIEGLFRRGIDPRGVARQFAAFLAAPDYRPLLKQIRVPTLVIHGREDPMFPVACGEETAACITGAKLEIIDGMGHDLPSELIDVIGGMVVEHARAQELIKRSI